MPGQDENEDGDVDGEYMQKPEEKVYENNNLKEQIQMAKWPVKDKEVPIYEVQEDSASSHFLAYSLTAIILIMATYLLYHNKSKIIAIIIEGKSSDGRRHRGQSYSKLDQNVSEAMPSLQETKEVKDFTF